MIMIIAETGIMKTELITCIHILWSAVEYYYSIYEESNEGTLYNSMMFKKPLLSFSFIRIIACKSNLHLLILFVLFQYGEGKPISSNDIYYIHGASFSPLKSHGKNPSARLESSWWDFHRNSEQ